MRTNNSTRLPPPGLAAPVTGWILIVLALLLALGGGVAFLTGTLDDYARAYDVIAFALP